MDDYQYKTLELPAKNQGLFGIGGMPNSEGIGFSGRLIDSSGGFVGGSAVGQGSQGQQGNEGEIGDSGKFPIPAVEGSILYYNGSEWIALPPPNSENDSILVFYSNNASWFTGYGVGYYLVTKYGQSGGGFGLNYPSEPGRFVLSSIGDNWFSVYNC